VVKPGRQDAVVSIDGGGGRAVVQKLNRRRLMVGDAFNNVLCLKIRLLDSVPCL